MARFLKAREIYNEIKKIPDIEKYILYYLLKKEKIPTKRYGLRSKMYDYDKLLEVIKSKYSHLVKNEK